MLYKGVSSTRYMVVALLPPKGSFSLFIQCLLESKTWGTTETEQAGGRHKAGVSQYFPLQTLLSFTLFLAPSCNYKSAQLEFQSNCMPSSVPLSTLSQVQGGVWEGEGSLFTLGVSKDAVVHCCYLKTVLPLSSSKILTQTKHTEGKKNLRYILSSLPSPALPYSSPFPNSYI